MFSPMASAFLLLNFILFLGSCQTLSTPKITLQLSSSSEKMAVFAIPNQDLSSILPKKISDRKVFIDSQIAMTEFLKSILVKKGFLSSEDWESLFSGTVLDELDFLLSDAIRKRPAFGYLVLIKMDDPLSPLTKLLRTSVIILKTIDGYVIAIPELKQNMTFPSQYIFDDWTLYEIPSLKPYYKRELKLKQSDALMSFYREDSPSKISIFGKVIIINDTNLLPKIPLLKISEEDEIQQPNKSTSVTERLKVLEDIRKKKLITGEEYKNKKKEILLDL